MKYLCNVCDWEYEEATGVPSQGIAQTVSFSSSKFAQFLEGIENGKEQLWQEAKKVLGAHRGEVPVCIFFEKTSEIKCTNKDLWCDGTEDLKTELEHLFGADCIKYK